MIAFSSTVSAITMSPLKEVAYLLQCLFKLLEGNFPSVNFLVPLLDFASALLTIFKSYPKRLRIDWAVLILRSECIDR